MSVALRYKWSTYVVLGMHMWHLMHATSSGSGYLTCWSVWYPYLKPGDLGCLWEVHSTCIKHRPMWHMWDHLQSPKMSNRCDILCLCFDGGSINLTNDPELKWQSAQWSLNTSQFKTQSCCPSHARHLCSTIPSHFYLCQRCIILILIIMVI